MKTITTSLITLLLVSGAQASSVLFDFESEDTTTNAALTSLTMTEGDLSLTLYRTSNIGFDIQDISLAGITQWGARTLSPFENQTTDDWFIGNFSTGVTEVSIEMGDAGDDSDILILEAYSGADGGGSLVDSMTFDWGLRNLLIDPPAVLTVSFAGGFESIRFRGGSPNFPNSMYYDNISATPVPEPGTMIALGLGTLALLRKRRSQS